MSSSTEGIPLPQYSVDRPAPHTLHQSCTADEFRSRFEAETLCPIQDVAEEFVSATTPRAIFAVGSIPLGMGSSGSDVDLIVLVDSRSAMRNAEERLANSEQCLQFSSDGDSLLASEFLTLRNGILVDLQVAIAPAVRDIYKRLQRRGPELNETEIRTLGRLSSGWRLWETDGYLQRSSIDLGSPTFLVYCSTKSFVSALLQRRKAERALETDDVPSAMQHGRSSVEAAYLAYFASEGLPYLGSKWLAQIGHARGAKDRIARHPLLAESVHLLFPTFGWATQETASYLADVSKFLTAMRNLIEQRLLFRIAFKACPQIHST